MPQSQKLACLIRKCFKLLDEEAKALVDEDLDRVSKLFEQKESAFVSLTDLLDAGPFEDFEDDVRLVYDRINENGTKLDELMEKADRELALLSRGRNRLRGLRNSYVKVPREGYLDRSQRFEA